MAEKRERNDTFLILQGVWCAASVSSTSIFAIVVCLLIAVLCFIAHIMVNR